MCEECGGSLRKKYSLTDEVQEPFGIESRLDDDVNESLVFTRFPSCLVIMVSSFMWKPQMTPRRWTTRTADII